VEVSHEIFADRVFRIEQIVAQIRDTLKLVLLIQELIVENFLFGALFRHPDERDTDFGGRLEL
jgi:hypothetical protein